jgi:hypothetical protein
VRAPVSLVGALPPRRPFPRAGPGFRPCRSPAEAPPRRAALRPSAMAGYLTSYYDVDKQKIGERLVTSDEQIAYLFHVVQEFVR